MAKKHKKKFNQHKKAATTDAVLQERADKQQPEAPSTLVTPNTTPTPQLSHTASSHTTALTIKELRNITVIFAFLLIVLTSVIALNSKTDTLHTLSDQLSKTLHIEE